MDSPFAHGDEEYTEEQAPEGFSLELEAQNEGGGIVQRAAVLHADTDLEDVDEDGSAHNGDDDVFDPDDAEDGELGSDI